MNKICLINLPIQKYLQKFFTEDFVYNPSLGLLYLGTWLELNGYEVQILDLCYEKVTLADLIKIVTTEDILLLGIAAYTENIDMAFSLAKSIKAANPNIKIVVGGAHATLMPLQVISCEYIDFVSRKEGESTLLELAEALFSKEKSIRFDDIPGLIFKRDNEIVENKVRYHIKDLNILPFPKRELVDFEKYNSIVNISTSRGCPSACIYCSATSISGAMYRTRDVENVFLEMLMIKKLLGDKLGKIYIVDDTFTAIPGRVKEFTELIKKYGLNVFWHCESRVDVMTEELLDSLAESNCIALQFGIESGSQEVLDKIQKGINLEYAKKMIDYTFRKGITICLSFMLGHYCDTKKTMEETCDLIKELFNKYKAEIAISFNTPFPGTWQYTHINKLGMRLVTENLKKFSLSTPVVETDNFSVDDQRKYYYEVRHCIAYMTSLVRFKEALEKNHG